MKAPKTLKGILVIETQLQSPAYQAGMRQGDVITRLNHQATPTIEAAQKILNKNKGKKVLIQAWRKAGGYFLVIKN